MRKVITVGLALVVTAAAVVLLGRSVHAQAGQSIVDLPALMSGGSRLGVSVRDVRTDDLTGAGLNEPRGVLVDHGYPAPPEREETAQEHEHDEDDVRERGRRDQRARSYTVEVSGIVRPGGS